MEHDLFFHHTFQFDSKKWSRANSFTLTLQSRLPGVEAWLNGVAVTSPTDRILQLGKWKCTLKKELFRNGVNVLAVGVSATAEALEVKGLTPEERDRMVDVHPQAGLRPRAGDEALDAKILGMLEWFKAFNQIPDPDKHPGTFVLRRYDANQTICDEGDIGHSAFYILTSEEVFAIRKHQYFRELGPNSPTGFVEFSPDRIRKETDSMPNALVEAAQRAFEVRGKGPTDGARLCAVACIGKGPSESRVSNRTRSSIRCDGVTDLDAETRQAKMYEGELFGEMACLNHTARSATVIATRTIYVVEFLRNVLDVVRAHPDYEKRMLEIYKERVFEIHLKDVDLFRDLTPDEMDQLKQNLTLKRVRAGTVIFQEGDEADCAYLIRLGVVQVLTGTEGLELSLEPADILDWVNLCRRIGELDPTRAVHCPECAATLFVTEKSIRGKLARCHKCEHVFPLENPESAEPIQAIEVETALAKGKPKAAAAPKLTPEQKRQQQELELEQACLKSLWESLPATIQRLVLRVKLLEASLSDEEQAALLAALDHAAQNPNDFKEVEKYLKRFEDRLSVILEKVNKWTRLSDYVRGRFLLHGLCPLAIKEPCFRDQSLRILAYRGRGDIIGEMGVVTRKQADGTEVNEQHNKRNATCIAYNHRDPDDAPMDKTKRSEVELIGIPKKTFNLLLEKNPALRDEIDEIVKRRRDQMKPMPSEQTARQNNPVLQTQEFHEQGLIQGQKLMLIDLESCTRCGDCLRGCVRTHADGHSRLFLDGPTYGKYLVPATCRLCEDPVCLIDCPVDAIHKGSHDEIVIEDWCIGCRNCYNQCPYDSIQMHDTGLIPENAGDWHVAAAKDVHKSAWQRQRRKWLLGPSWKPCSPPFQWDIGFRDLFDPKDDQALIDQLSQSLAYGHAIFSARLDSDRAVPVPSGKSQNDVNIKGTPFLAAVCDQCSSLPNQQPACVVECPHEAAFRIEANAEFPFS